MIENLAERTIVGRLGYEEQKVLIDDARAVVKACRGLSALPGGMTVRIANAGRWGWWAWAVGDYEYVDRHPVTGLPWPKLPESWRRLFRRFATNDTEPDCGHLVYYAPGARLGFHEDRTEASQEGSVVTATVCRKRTRARWGVESLEGVRTWTTLRSGDVTLLEGPTRRLRHTIDRVECEPSNVRGLFDVEDEPSPYEREGRVAISVRSGAGPGRFL